MARIRKTTASAYSVLEVINDGEGGSIHADGKLQVDGDLDLDVNIAGVALDVNNANTGGSSVGISSTGRTALQAHGHISLDSDKILALDGTTGQNYMKYNSAESRIEFYIGGHLVFIVDSNGGHNP